MPPAERDPVTAESCLRVAVLGETRVELDGNPLPGPWLDQRPGMLLKFLLAKRGRTVKVDEIAEELWPGAGYAAMANVRYYVHVLRKTLEPERTSRAQSLFVTCRAGGYAVDRDRVSLDADQFESELGAGRTAQALDLYRGEFLADEPYAAWAQNERQRLHELACDGLRELAQACLQEGALIAGHQYLARLAEHLPYDEDVHRQLIALDLERGRRSDALRRYSVLRTRLRREFGEDPSFTPADLRVCVRA
jgi:DNA-binding SARP family transcriptional activator